MTQANPEIIQGGMGVGVSDWRLARAVSRAGELGVVSGTGIGIVIARRLQIGDPGGHVRRALAAFPVPSIAERLLDKYFVDGGKRSEQRFRPVPMFTKKTQRVLIDLIVCANFAEVWLAKEGHDGLVGVNYLEKVQRPHLPSLYGAMLAGVDFVLMGAGIPVQIAGVLDSLSQHRKSVYKLDVIGALPGDSFETEFDPEALFPSLTHEPLKRPQFLAIIASNLLAKVLVAKSSGKVNGFVVEGPTAGGHNAPPRGKLQLDERGQPIYGERDIVDYAKLCELGLPFWLAGSYASPERLREARSVGASGVQVGTAFALCNESGLTEDYKAELRQMAFRRQLDILTDPLASPSNYPFKVAQLSGSLSDRDVYEDRPRLCDIGRLQELYREADESLGMRCPAEPVDDYIAKGGKAEDTVDRKCLCNTLFANIGLGQRQPRGYLEPPLFTLGDDVGFLRRIVCNENETYSALDVITFLRGTRPSIGLSERIGFAVPEAAQRS